MSQYPSLTIVARGRVPAMDDKKGSRCCNPLAFKQEYAGLTSAILRGGEKGGRRGMLGVGGGDGLVRRLELEATLQGSPFFPRRGIRGRGG
eukprot:1379994-Amorphochlora_amoeboformis.AAC.1